jgi:hypothetical protein
LQWALDAIREDGIEQIFVNSRVPSYNGSSEHIQENIRQNIDFKKVIDGHLSGDEFPSNMELARDRVIRFYLKNGLQPWRILPDYTNDCPSGNMSIICRMHPEQNDPEMNKNA